MSQSTMAQKGSQKSATQADVKNQPSNYSSKSDAEIKASTDWKYLVALSNESKSYDGFYAVASAVRNRVKQSGFPNTYKGVVTQSKQFAGYRAADIGKPQNASISKAAVDVLKGGASSVKDYPFFLGRVSGYDMWYEKSKAGSDTPIVAAPGDNMHNVFFKKWGTVHNMAKKKTSDAVTLYDAKAGKWTMNGAKGTQTQSSSSKGSAKQAVVSNGKTLDVDAIKEWYKAQNYSQAFIKEIQAKIGLKGKEVDGKIGPQTINRVADWQNNNGLAPGDGKFGPKSITKAGLKAKYNTSASSSSSQSHSQTTSGGSSASVSAPAGKLSHKLSSNTAKWCKDNGFIGSQKVSDLKGDFKPAATSIVNAIGSNLTVNSTFRHQARCAMMYYARYFGNATKENKAKSVLSQYGVTVSGDSAGAQAARSSFGIGSKPVGLYSNHRNGDAMDMNVKSLPSSFTVDGTKINVSGSNGSYEDNADRLHKAIQGSNWKHKSHFIWYNAVHSDKDTVHWSKTGN